MLSPLPALAQQNTPLDDEILKFFEDFADPFLPLLDDLADQIKDLSLYHAPEILPNGDIIIRKRKPGETLPETEPDTKREPPLAEDEAIEL